MKALLYLGISVIISSCGKPILDFQEVKGPLPDVPTIELSRLEGTYEGTFTRPQSPEQNSSWVTEPISVEIAIENDKITMTPNKDLISARCASAIGAITMSTSRAIYVMKRQLLLLFPFDPNRCGLVTEQYVQAEFPMESSLKTLYISYSIGKPEDQYAYSGPLVLKSSKMPTGAELWPLPTKNQNSLRVAANSGSRKTFSQSKSEK